MAQLFPRFTQDTRLLRLTTPLGPDKLLAECLRGDESLSRGYRLELSVLSTDSRIASDSLLGQPVLLELLTATPAMPLRPFHGHVTGVERVGANGGFARYALTVEPWSTFMAFGRDSRIFQDKTVFDILDAVFQGWQSLGKLTPAWRYDIVERSVYPIRSLTCQYQESNLAFAERLMHEEGLFYYFEHSAVPDSPRLGSHTLVIANHNGSFKANAQAEARFTQPGAVMREDSIDRWRIESRSVICVTAISDARADDPRDPRRLCGRHSKRKRRIRRTLGALQDVIKRNVYATSVLHDHIGITQELNDHRNDAFLPIDEYMGQTEGSGPHNRRKFDVYHQIDEWRTLVEKGLVSDAEKSIERADFLRRVRREPLFLDDSKEMMNAKCSQTGVVPTRAELQKFPRRQEWETDHPKIVEELEQALQRDEDNYMEFAHHKAKQDWHDR